MLAEDYVDLYSTALKSHRYVIPEDVLISETTNNEVMRGVYSIRCIRQHGFSQYCVLTSVKSTRETYPTKISVKRKPKITTQKSIKLYDWVFDKPVKCVIKEYNTITKQAKAIHCV